MQVLILCISFASCKHNTALHTLHDAGGCLQSTGAPAPCLRVQTPPDMGPPIHTTVCRLALIIGTHIHAHNPTCVPLSCVCLRVVVDCLLTVCCNTVCASCCSHMNRLGHNTQTDAAGATARACLCTVYLA